MESDDMNDRDTATVLDALRSDMDTVTLYGATVYRLRIEPDPYMSIMDEQGIGVWCGELAHSPRNPCTGHSVRPDHFGGRSEILVRGDWRSDNLWWNVPEDIVIGSDTHRSLRQTICDLILYGYVTVSLERCEGTDAYGRPVVVGFSCLGGVEAMFNDDYLRDIIGDLLEELEPQVSV